MAFFIMTEPNSEDIFEVLFEDAHYIAINKPHSILVHRTGLSQDTRFVLQLLRDQIGRRVYPVHRLDRATSGVLIFGKSAEAASRLGVLFMDKNVEKRYWAVVRGFAKDRETIDYPLEDPETGKGLMPAVTHYTKIAQTELEAAIGLRYPTARFSLVEARPETGRRHQIRKHFAHLRHPVIGDVRHGDNKHNNFFRDVWGIQRLLLHAVSLRFEHPYTEQIVGIEASMDDLFLKALDILKFPGYTAGRFIPSPEAFRV
jgi:tRNA pseudouridine65 synthase